MFKAGFLNLDTMDIFNQTILCVWRGAPCASQEVKQHPDLYPREASGPQPLAVTPKIFPDVVKFPLGDKIAPQLRASDFEEEEDWGGNILYTRIFGEGYTLRKSRAAGGKTEKRE